MANKKINILGIKTKILSKKTRISYTPTLEVIDKKQKKDWFVALWHSFSYVEHQLRELLLWKKLNYASKGRAKYYDKIMNIRKFAWIIKEARRLKVIGKGDYKKLNYIRDVRNDMAHSWLLVYNENINEKEANRLIKSSLDLSHRLHNKLVSGQKKIKKNSVKKVNV